MSANYRKIGERVQQARNVRGMTMGDLANKVHFTPKSIALVEAGQAEMNVSLLLSLCTALNVTPNDLLEGEYQVTGTTKSLEEESLLTEMREILIALKGGEDDGTVIRDSETVVREIREMLRDEKIEEKANASVGSAFSGTRAKTQPKKGGSRPHYF